MNHSGDKTEQPTQRRLQKAREEGRFPSSRDLLGGVQILLVMMMAGFAGPEFVSGIKEGVARMLGNAAEQPVEPRHVVNLAVFLSARFFIPFFKAGAVLVGLTLLVQIASTGLGFSWKRLTPTWGKMNPWSRLKSIPSQNLPSLVSSILLLGLMVQSIVWLMKERLPVLIQTALGDLQSGLSTAGFQINDLLWRGAWVLLAVGVADYFRQYRRHQTDMRMTKQEVRDEAKESEGSPLVRMRIRRLQRDMRRMRMMRDVPGANVVVANPTHFAVALKYDHGSMPAPHVVAKGRGYIALRIREIAAQHGVPVVENPPLARALYKVTEIGQEIPPDMYRAIAEILAYVYRLANPASSR